MDASVISLLISLVSGAAGGNVAGSLFKNLSLGTLWNSVAGVVGGGALTKILGLAVPILSGAGGFDIGSIIAQIVSGGAGGGILMAILGALKGMTNR